MTHISKTIHLYNLNKIPLTTSLIHVYQILKTNNKKWPVMHFIRLLVQGVA